MIIVTNTIQVKNGFGDKLMGMFKNAKGVQSFPGFVRLELLKTQGLTEYEEVQVCTAWETKEAFDAWVASDSFKQSHSRGGGSSPNEMMIGSKISVHEVVHTHLPTPATV